MMQPFHPVFRHLWYFAAIVMVGLAVLGFSYEKLGGNTSGLAILGLTASIVHGAAWWFTVGVTSPLKKFGACVLLFVGAMLSAAAGRFTFLWIGELPYEPLKTNMQFVAGLVPMWWLSLTVVTGVAKELMRWRLNFRHTPISPRTSLLDMFQLMAIIGVILAFFSSSVASVAGTEYEALLLVSVCLHLFLLLPFSMLILSTPRWGLSRVALIGVVGFGFFGLLLLALARYFGDEFEGVSDVAVGFGALVVPYVLMLLWGREEDLGLSSGWFKEPEIETF